MASRHLSRSIVVQSLFEWDFNNLSDDKINDIVERNINEFAPGIDNKSFAKNLASDILKNIKKIDEIISKAAPEWPLNQIALVDRNILRLGLYELLFGKRDEVPAKVAINESIELAKSLGGSSSSKFVNGVLGTVYKEIGEPGKDATKKKRDKDDPNKLPKESLGGAVVYSKHKGDIYIVFIHNVFGFWTLPKGRIDLTTKESVRDCAIRETKEETGLDIKIESVLDVNEYVAKTTERGTLLKKVSYFLASSSFKELELEKPEEKAFRSLDDVKWFKLEEIPELKVYDDIRPIITKAVKILISK